VRSAIKVKVGLLQSTRNPQRKSRQHVSTKDSQPPPERTTSFAISRLPRSKRTARRASFGLIPCFVFSSAAILKKSVSSSSNSLSTRSLLNSDRNPCDRFRSSDMDPHSSYENTAQAV